MKINIEFDESLTENEIIIRCASFNEEIHRLQTAISDVALFAKKLVCYQKETEYYIPFDDILFFETEAGHMNVHTKNQVYMIKRRLCELEEMLPGAFMRVSKSTILNTNRIYSITKNLTSASVVEFAGTHKQVYVSRHYYKPLKFKLEEKRNAL